ncbi:acetamidase/formamidase family protein [Ornithinibacillus sp. 4-3]|uniref:Acetamidase/formamidase family protein n=1 Tax=Ornithinibacillus sp. 4-3 TaxID=3231488 RepID=A0AB39HPF5_9BACI
MKIIPKEKFVISMSPEHEAVETVPSGSTVVFEAYDCFSNKLETTADKFSKVGWDKINPATGPLYVEGANPGDTLKVEILDIEIADQGVMATVPGLGSLKNRINEETTKIIPIRDGKAIFSEHIEIPIDPMIGVIGTAPKEGDIPTGSPGDHGANMDCKKITKGATLYLPVNVAGGMLAMGDAHAVMSDGEVLICGLEIPSKTTVKVTVLEGQEYPLPFLTNDTHLMTIAAADTLDEASVRATENMHAFLEEQVKLSAAEAGMLLSLVGDLKICQIVNPLKTTRMELPRNILEKYNITLK